LNRKECGEVKSHMTWKCRCALLTACAGISFGAMAEYTPAKWNLEAREKFAAHRYGVFIVWGLYANYAQGE